jgi:uncharacterized membrane protein
LSNKSNGNLSNLEQSQQIAATHVAASSYVGPIPSASEMAKYAGIDPSFPDRILTMAEKQSAHRQKVEQTLADAYARNSSRGVNYAFILSLIMLLIGGYCIICLDKDIFGAIFGVTGIGSIVGAFIYGTRSKRSRDDKKE